MFIAYGCIIMTENKTPVSRAVLAGGPEVFAKYG